MKFIMNCLPLDRYMKKRFQMISKCNCKIVQGIFNSLNFSKKKCVLQGLILKLVHVVCKCTALTNNDRAKRN